MRHRKNTFKVGRTSSHKRGMLANMLKNLIENERLITTVTKAKELRKHADRLITIAKDNNLAARRRAIAKLEVRYNTLSSKDMRAVRGGSEQTYNMDRRVIGKLFDTLGPRFANRQGGYTRLIKSANRRGDNCQTCVIEYLSE